MVCMPIATMAAFANNRLQAKIIIFADIELFFSNIKIPNPNKIRISNTSRAVPKAKTKF